MNTTGTDSDVAYMRKNKQWYRLAKTLRAHPRITTTTATTTATATDTAAQQHKIILAHASAGLHLDVCVCDNVCVTPGTGWQRHCRSRWLGSAALPSESNWRAIVDSRLRLRLCGSLCMLFCPCGAVVAVVLRE